MTPEKIISIIEKYEEELARYNAERKRVKTSWTFRDAPRACVLDHAYYLCTGAKEFARDPERQGKANRHFAAIQMCLSFAGWYTLEELMNHNRPDEDGVATTFIPLPYRLLRK